MPGATPVRGIPYPSPTDPINAYPALAQQAATKLDTHTHDSVANAGNADTLDGLHAANFMRADGIYVGRVTITTDSNGQAWVNAGGKTAVLVANVSDPDAGNTGWFVSWNANRVRILFQFGELTMPFAGSVTLNVVAV